MGAVPHEEEIKFIFLKVVEQTIRDYINFAGAKTPSERFCFETANGFLFDDAYTIDWGGSDLSLNQILAILDLDIDWLRRKVNVLRNKKLKRRVTSRDDVIKILTTQEGDDEQ